MRISVWSSDVCSSDLTVELIGEAVFTVDTATVAHTGGTVVANGGLVLTGTLLGDVTTEGDGTFTLGAGGTEGQFAGDLVNNGRFVFNRSEDRKSTRLNSSH